MLAIIALVAFVLAFFKVHLGGFDLVILGFCFLALHFIFGERVWGPWRRNP